MRTMILAAVVAVGALSAPAAIAAPVGSPNSWAPVPGVGDIRLNGYWHIDEAARTAGQAAATRAQLTPAAQPIIEQNRMIAEERRKRAEFVNAQAAICGLQGVPGVVGTSEPWLLTIGKDAIVQTAERYQLSPRFFYTDGRTMPDVTKMPKSSSGYSIAHWEGKTLVIETRGMGPGGFSGGGIKSPTTELTERVSLDEAGNRLTWTYIWKDPVMMSNTVTYSIMYDRGPEHSYSMYQLCDPNQGNQRLAVAPAQEGPAQ